MNICLNYEIRGLREVVSPNLKVNVLLNISTGPDSVKQSVGGGVKLAPRI